MAVFSPSSASSFNERSILKQCFLELRTGKTRQHLTDHTGSMFGWADEKDQCRYNQAGDILNPQCSVEPACRDHTTWGQTFCMRDHYYQLFDLEKNFGEKTFCKNSGNKNANLEGVANPFLHLLPVNFQSTLC